MSIDRIAHCVNVIAKYIDDKIKVRLRRQYDNLNPADLN